MPRTPEEKFELLLKPAMKFLGDRLAERGDLLKDPNATTRIAGTLNSEGFRQRTLGELLTLTEKQFELLPGMARKTQEMLYAVLRDEGFRMGSLKLLVDIFPDSVILDGHHRHVRMEVVEIHINNMRERKADIINLLNYNPAGPKPSSFTLTAIFSDEEAAMAGVSLGEIEALSRDPDFRRKLLGWFREASRADAVKALPAPKLDEGPA